MEFLKLQVCPVYAQIQKLKICGVLHVLDAKHQGVCCGFEEDFSLNCCMFFKMLTIEKELSIADIRGDSNVNVAVFFRIWDVCIHFSYITTM